MKCKLVYVIYALYIISSMYSQFSDRVRLPLHNIPSPGVLLMLMFVQLHLISSRPSRGDHHIQSPPFRLLLNPVRQERSSTLPRKISS